MTNELTLIGGSQHCRLAECHYHSEYQHCCRETYHTMPMSSPKRKRLPDVSSASHSSSPLPTHIQLDSTMPTAEGGSPRSKMASKFQKLCLDRDEYDGIDGRERKRRPQSDTVDETPSLSPSPTPVAREIQETGSVDGHFPPHTDATITTTTPEHRPHSPTVSGDPNDLYWLDSEITGYAPDDPTDDGYGINGVGFRPTAAIAYSRSQRRKQQLAEYRNREAKEARQRRSEKRRLEAQESHTSITQPASNQTKVHFEDG